nr:4,5-DOPA dioxygenase extradiol [Flavihumibacter sp.]
WNRLDDPGFGFDWAIAANELFKSLIISCDHKALMDYSSLGKEAQLAIPTPEHYLPLLYSLALQGPSDTIDFFNDQLVGGSLTMTSVKIANN